MPHSDASSEQQPARGRVVLSKHQAGSQLPRASAPRGDGRVKAEPDWVVWVGPSSACLSVPWRC